MKMENPLPGGQRAFVSIGPDANSLTRPRPILQANAAMRDRLNVLLWMGGLAR